MNERNERDVVLGVRAVEAGDSERARRVIRAKTNTQIPRTHLLIPRDVRNGNSFVSRRHAASDWQRALAVISKQWRWSALFAAIVIALTTVATFVMKPVYESEGRLQIDPPGAEVFTLDAAGAGLIDSEYITTEAQKLQTDDLALATIRALHLDTNPEITGKIPKQYATGDGSYQLMFRENAAGRGFESRLSIRRDPSSRLVGVAFATHHPRLPAEVVNTLMKLLVERSFEARHEASQESSAWLSHQRHDIGAKPKPATPARTDI